MVNLSPTDDSFHESLCSLRLAKQVNQCELGKPKRQLKEVVKDTPSTSTSSSHHVSTTPLTPSGKRQHPPTSSSATSSGLHLQNKRLAVKKL